MPIDPTIPLGGTPVPTPTNPLTTLGSMAGLMNVGSEIQLRQQEIKNQQLQQQTFQNQIAQFKQVFGARQKLGGIMSTAPDIATGLAQAQRDPDIAAQPSVLNEYRALQQTMAGIGLTQQQTRTSASEASVNAARLPEIAAETQQAQAGTMERMASAARTGVGMNDDLSRGLLTQLTGALGDPSKAQLIGQQFLAGLPQNVAQQYSPVVKSVIDSLAPTSSDPAQAQAQYQNNLINRIAGSGHGEDVIRTLQQLPQGPSSPTGGALAPAQPAATQASTVPFAGDGKPLFTPGALTPTGAAQATTLRGSANLQRGSQQLLDEFNGPELKAYTAAQTIKAQAQELESSFDTLAKAGGPHTMGAGSSASTVIMNGVNKIAEGLGQSAPFDPKAVAAGELALKDTKRMGFSVANAAFGAQKEGVQTIQDSIAQVPGIDNTYLGGKVLLSSIKAQAQYLTDQREFKQWWMQQPGHEGDPTGAVEAFNKLHPPSSYAAAALDQYGLKPDGFKTRSDVVKALRGNLLTPDEAKNLLDTQWPQYKAKTGE